MVGAFSADAKHVCFGAKILPPACAADVPDDDPYWNQMDSYVVKQAFPGGTYNVTYNECRYSDGCKKQFTNRERVQSMRATVHATKQLMVKHSMQHLLFGGVAIGAYRCGDVLPWDVDTDVVVQQAQLPRLLKLLVKDSNGTGWYGHGKSLDLASEGLPGFVLMEKFPGCMPLVVVDKSTGFFTDVFTMLPMSNGEVFTPYWSGRACDTQELFSGCSWGKCTASKAAVMLPPTEAGCAIYGVKQFCASNLKGWLLAHFGPGMVKPDRAVRSAGTVALKREKRVSNTTSSAI
jgi:hypothetical protein